MASEKSPEKREPANQEKKEIVPSKPKRRLRSMIRANETAEILRDFDSIFERFRSDFEDLLCPSDKLLDRAYSMLPKMREAGPSIDLENRGNEFYLTAEMPGLKKENVEIEVEDQAVDIRGKTTLAQDDKMEKYVRKERATQSFHRRIDLPEEIMTDNVQAHMMDGVLELVLPKKYPKERRKINIK